MKQSTMLAGVLGMGLVIGGCDTLKEVSQDLGKTNFSYTMKNGQKVQGTLLHDDDGKSLVQVKYGTLTLTKGDVLSVEREGKADPTNPGTGRLAKWDHALQQVAARPWAASLTQIPATVVDKGIMKFVPYVSHRAGSYEFNIYGDPDQPACLELGIYGSVISSADRKECAQTLSALLNQDKDRQMVQLIDLDKGIHRANGLTLEVTPPTAEDAYGAWWISVYDEKALAEQRAKDSELSRITVTHEQVKSQAKDAAISAAASALSSLLSWKDHDLQSARPAAAPAPDAARVYVRGVYRKKGVYVVWPA